MTDINSKNVPSTNSPVPNSDLNAPNIETDAALRILRLARESGALDANEEARLDEIESQISETSAALVAALKRVLNIDPKEPISARSLEYQIGRLDTDKLYRILNIVGVQQDANSLNTGKEWNLSWVCWHVANFIRAVSSGLADLDEMQRVAAAFEYDSSIVSPVRTRFAAISKVTVSVVSDTLALFYSFKERLRAESFWGGSEEIELKLNVEDSNNTKARTVSKSDFIPPPLSPEKTDRLYHGDFETLANDDAMGDLMLEIVRLENELDEEWRILLSAKNGDLPMVRGQIGQTQIQIANRRCELRNRMASEYLYAV